MMTSDGDSPGEPQRGDDAPPRIGMDILDSMTPEELDELDQGRYLCPDCGRFYAPDGEDGHYGCPAPACH